MFQLDSDIYNKSRQATLSERLGNSQIDENSEKVRQAKLERASHYLAMATPDNWQAIRSQAIGEGLGGEDTIPQQFDQNWINQTKNAFDTHRADTPSAVQEYSFYNKLAPAEQEKYLNVKRAAQVINLGGSQVVRNPTGGIAEAYAVTPKPEDMPEFKGQQAQATEVGKQLGETESDLNAAQSAMPQLEAAVQTLSDLGKKATYTVAGQGVNAVRRQAGLSATEGAQARAEYIAHVKNNVLPLLRRTFGAQFTKAEGDSLLATLGDPNSSPKEKDATLRAFIGDKKATLQTMQRQAGRKLTDQVPTSQDPRIQKAREAGYSEEEIQQYLNGRK